MTRRRKLLIVVMYLVSLSVNAQTDSGSLHLFADSAKMEISPIVCNFLERYLYQASKSQRGYDFYQRMADDKVVLRDGSFDNIPKLSSNVLFEINRFEDKGYEVSWKDLRGKILLSLQFPIKSELLLGMPKAEIEKTMKGQLQSYPDTTCLWTADSVLSSVEGEILRSTVSEYYYVKSLNTETYYKSSPRYRRRRTGTAEQKAYSSANLFHGLIKETDKYKIHIDQNLYGFKEESYIIPLNQWLNYCLINKLKIYFGIEEERTDGLKALIIAKDNDLGFCHMMTVILPENFVDKHDTILKAVLNAYIPLDNVKDLYQEYSKKQNKK